MKMNRATQINLSVLTWQHVVFKSHQFSKLPHPETDPDAKQYEKNQNMHFNACC